MSSEEARCGRFADPGLLPDNSVFAREGEFRGTSELGSRIQVKTNCYSYVMAEGGGIYHYRFSIDPRPGNRAEEQAVFEGIWTQLQQDFGTFVVQFPGSLFSAQKVEPVDAASGGPLREYTMAVEACPEEVEKAHTVSIRLHQEFCAADVNQGLAGDAEVVFKHLSKRIAQLRAYQKVGRRFYDSYDSLGGKGQLLVYAGFYAAMCRHSRSMPRLVVDTAYRAALDSKNILQTLRAVLESTCPVSNPLAHNFAEVRDCWLRRLVGSTVVTLYNGRFYRIKKVHFDKGPDEEFDFRPRPREAGTEVKMSIAEYYRDYYQKNIVDRKQPLLEAYAEKDTETVWLVPELCALTGFNDEMRKDKSVLSEALKTTKVSPQDRSKSIQELVDFMAERSKEPTGKKERAISNLMQEWKVSINPKPVEVEAHAFQTTGGPHITFHPHDTKKYTPEEGNFQRWMRNGLQCPANITDWIFICPEQDRSVITIWLRSLRDIASMAFKMTTADPVWIFCDNQREELKTKLEQNVKPETQLILLIAPQKDSSHVYRMFKKECCLKYPVATQVVKSETVRKRNAIAAVLSKIVLQINAKFCGPLWQVELKVDNTLFSRPTMAVGIDVFTARDGSKQMGFVASLDTHCTDFYSVSYPLDKGKDSDDARTREIKEERSMAVKVQEAMRDALLCFRERNEGVMPEHVLAYRGSINDTDWHTVKATEIDGLERVLGAVACASTEGEPYRPKFTFVAVNSRTNMRFFVPTTTPDTVRNPEAGTVIDCDEMSCGAPGFYLISQYVSKGTAVPTQFVVLHDTGQVSADTLQLLTYRLSYMYYNCTCSIKVPAPLQYAKKIAHFVGTVVQGEVHPRLSRTLFYL